VSNNPSNAQDPITIPYTVPADLIDSMNSMRHPVIVAHVRPDADALASMIAVALGWRRNEITPKVALPGGSLSQRLGFMFDMAKVPVATAADFAQADGFIAVDTAKQSRCNLPPELKNKDWPAGRPIANIDHHGTNTLFGQYNWVEPEASSTAELIYHLLRAAGKAIDRTMASLLFAGIHADTSGFALSNTTASSLQAASELVQLGADVAEIGERLCHSQTRSLFDLLRVIYAHTKVLADGRLAYSTASYDEIIGSGCTAADIDDQVDVVRSLDGVQLAMLFTEGVPGKTRINFRGSGPVTVVDLAAKFKGGGHQRAAGAVINGSLLEVVHRVIPEAIEHLNRF
jgi:phosphoesterase RecJ-like protein